jgi:hypothetical protein
VKTLENGMTTHVHRSAELILRKWLYDQKQSTDSIQSPQKFKCHFHRNRKFNSKIQTEVQESPNRKSKKSNNVVSQKQTSN